MFLLKKILAALALPPTGPLLLALAGLVLWNRLPRAGRVLAWSGTLGLLLLSLPLVAAALSILVCDADALQRPDAVDAQAIVILGSGIRTETPEYGADAPSAMTLERLRYGAFLAKRTGLPVLVSGGAVFTGNPEAGVMSEVLEREFGVKVTWREGRSRDTHQNAAFSAPLLHDAGVKRLLLVTHGIDSRRGRREFESQGFEVIAAPTVIPTLSADSLWDLIPSMGALRGSYFALYELLGNLQVVLREQLYEPSGPGQRSPTSPSNG